MRKNSPFKLTVLGLCALFLGASGDARPQSDIEDSENLAMVCYSATVLAGMQLQKDGDAARGDPFVANSGYWRGRMGKYATTEGLPELEKMINGLAQDKTLAELIDIADYCLLRSEGYSDTQIAQTMADRRAAAAQQAEEAQRAEDARHAEALDAQLTVCYKRITPYIQGATEQHKKAYEQAGLWMSYRNAGVNPENYAHGHIKDGCRMIDQAWAELNALGCPDQVFREVQQYKNNYYVDMGPYGQITCGY